ncbi:MAG TPA: ThiF family adenylyltransferase [Tepidisphaeraceae bacterium]|nr:ThiF family adenylyltransferase [Tepidisphaeraceae bacterium]
MSTDRYHRQTLLPQIGPAGQAKLAASRVLLIGCGALGTVLADYLVRAGVGWLRIVDRDLVEPTNLQRQTLFVEADVDQPKAVAAAARLRQVNSRSTIEPLVADVFAGNVEHLTDVRGDGPMVDLVLDGTDNAETRYLVNDVAVKHGVPWVYGAAVAVEGRVMAIDPRAGTPCLRCVFPQPPAVGQLATCDTAGVLGPAAGVTASLQAAAAIRLLVGGGTNHVLTSFDAWDGRLRTLSLADAKRDDCPACGHRRFEFLDAVAVPTVTLCGRDAVQVRPATPTRLVLRELAMTLARSGKVEATPHLLRFASDGALRVRLTVFADGRVIVHGTTRADEARSVVARYVGT